MYPFFFALQTIPKFIGFSADQTAQIMGKDILNPLPVGSILLLRSDTPLFPTLYVRYGLRYRPDVYVIHASRLEAVDFQTSLPKIFPDLIYPTQKPRTSYTDAFIRSNRVSRAIFTNITFPLDDGWHWVPFGLAYQAVPTAKLPNIATFLSDNDRIWELLHNPSSGILSRYNHLILSDVRDFYAQSRIMYGNVVLRAGLLEQAKRQFEQAIALGGDGTLPMAYKAHGLASLFLNQCTEAMMSFRQAKTLDQDLVKDILYYEAITARDCAKNVESANDLFLEYQREKKQQDIPLALPQ